ncbi:FAD-dependent oxidoreductase [Devosia aurantiaca]|uniref:FAD-dependent oxidoreductase n=1 Tax=Devosia aurantiaca TaxID=2714858 RepID=UPI002E294A34|nr:FAD-dependent oxidoreductase [Devosia aurantiaca]
MFHASAGFSGSEPLRQRIAVIGSGVSGLSAAWLLAQTNDIVLYEADARLGGHANTVDVPGTGPVDTGFIVYNEQNYPNFSALMSHLSG